MWALLVRTSGETCVMPNALGAREKSRVSLKRVPVQPVPVKQEEVTTSASDVPQSDEEMPDVKPVASSSAPNPPLQIDSSCSQEVHCEVSCLLICVICVKFKLEASFSFI